MVVITAMSAGMTSWQKKMAQHKSHIVLPRSHCEVRTREVDESCHISKVACVLLACVSQRGGDGENEPEPYGYLKLLVSAIKIRVVLTFSTTTTQSTCSK